MRPLDPHAAYWARWKFARLAIPLTERARELGYALLVHGSLQRDIDMVAVPWTVNAVDPADFVREFVAAIRKHDISPESEIEPTQGPTEKPHGRVACSIFVQGTYFDLSVMPTAAETGEDRKLALLRRVEWGGMDECGYPVCPVCGGFDPKFSERITDKPSIGHRPDCDLARELRPDPMPTTAEAT